MEYLSQKSGFEQILQQQRLSRKSAIILFFCALAAFQASSALWERYIAIGFRNANTGYSYAILLAALVVIAIIGHKHRQLLLPLALIVAGGVSNALDRLFLGFVRDPIGIFSWQGNIADMGIGIGVLWAIWLYTKE